MHCTLPDTEDNACEMIASSFQKAEWKKNADLGKFKIEKRLIKNNGLVVAAEEHAHFLLACRQRNVYGI